MTLHIGVLIPVMCEPNGSIVIQSIMSNVAFCPEARLHHKTARPETDPTFRNNKFFTQYLSQKRQFAKFRICLPGEDIGGIYAPPPCSLIFNRARCALLLKTLAYVRRRVTIDLRTLVLPLRSTLSVQTQEAPQTNLRICAILLRLVERGNPLFSWSTFSRMFAADWRNHKPVQSDLINCYGAQPDFATLRRKLVIVNSHDRIFWTVPVTCSAAFVFLPELPFPSRRLNSMLLRRTRGNSTVGVERVSDRPNQRRGSRHMRLKFTRMHVDSRRWLKRKASVSFENTLTLRRRHCDSHERLHSSGRPIFPEHTLRGGTPNRFPTLTKTFIPRV
jgi:hypothetical protein